MYRKCYGRLYMYADPDLHGQDFLLLFIKFHHQKPIASPTCAYWLHVGHFNFMNFYDSQANNLC